MARRRVRAEGRVPSRFAVQRYRARVLTSRLSMGWPPALQVVNLLLAVVGAWTVVYQPVRRLMSQDAIAGLVASVVAIVVVIALSWFRLARRPQALFKVAAADEDRAEALRGLMRDGLTQDFAYENLARLYAPVVEAAAGATWPTDAEGKRCLVVTMAGRRDISDIIVEVDGARDEVWRQRVSTFAPERQGFIATLRRSVSLSNKFGDEAGTNVVLSEIGPECAIKVATASYGQIMRTSDSLVNEFALFAALASRSAVRGRPCPLDFNPDDLLKVLPWRRQVHQWDAGGDLLTAPRGRASGLGVSLVLVDRGDAFVARRSPKVGTYPDVLHVVPSGMMNSHGAPREAAALPRLTMLSEFLEECFDVAELDGHAAGNFVKRVEEKLSQFGLSDLEPVFTGLAIDLLNLRTEVCGVLDLSARRSVVDAFNLSWEYAHTDPLRRIGLTDYAASVRRTDYVQSGIGSMQLASVWLAARTAPREAM